MWNIYKELSFATLFSLVPAIVNANGYIQKGPYVAPPYVAPPPIPSRLKLIDNGEGNPSPKQSQNSCGQKKDSFADLGKCLNWYDSKNYVENLTTGGYTDWRVPEVWEYGENF
ncbi:MAG: hypothetical protein Ct9H300mP23_10660 [Nitrospinota bacterium]|nr:MAG: hypothetical protein Ct9H300mP23_10660 [Nitrospinota bacterium]